MTKHSCGVKDSFRLTYIGRGDSAYPTSVKKFFGDQAPERICLLGNSELLPKELLGFFCSIKCPGDIILKTFDLVRAVREAGIPLIGGFHTPMERECLDILLRGSQPIVICPARGLERLRPSRKVRDGIETGRILLVSPFGPNYRRATAELAEQRNRLVAALASAAFISHAAPGGKTEALCREIIAMGKPIFTVDSHENSNLLARGAKPVTVDVVAHQWLKRGIAW